jgi:hypothetical protein
LAAIPPNVTLRWLNKTRYLPSVTAVAPTLLAGYTQFQNERHRV